MNILIVGNVLKDVYLNLDTHSDKFELDSHSINWLDLEFNATDHHYFERTSSFGGAAITLDVLQKLGTSASISGKDFALDEDGISKSCPADAYRYILVANGNPCYFVPSTFTKTSFTAPSTPVDCVYIDRSASLTDEAISAIEALDTKLVVYIKDGSSPNLMKLAKKATIVFTESEDVAKDIPAEKLVMISESKISYKEVSEPINAPRIDTLTHLSAYSIISATILGCFSLGKKVEESLRYARLNVENATLNSVLSLKELEKINANFNPAESLELIAANLVLPGKGILAADESGGSIQKKFAQLDIPDTFENRHSYRDIFFTTPGLEDHVNGVILFDETARDHADNGETYVDFLISHRIIPGIKVDGGLTPFNGSEIETVTKGLEDLEPRLKEYYTMGLRFAKWRAAFHITDSTPSDANIRENCRILADYASKCQSAGIVPIVEPEVVYDDYYPIEKNIEVTSGILDCLFENLEKFGVNLRACVLKVNMVLAGKQYITQSTPEEVGRATALVLKNHVPAELAGVVFLSGGQTVEQATDNLAEIVKNGPFAWPVTFSFARALQDPALFTWKGDNANSAAARDAFLARLKANTAVLPH